MYEQFFKDENMDEEALWFLRMYFDRIYRRTTFDTVDYGEDIIKRDTQNPDRKTIEAISKKVLGNTTETPSLGSESLSRIQEHFNQIYYGNYLHDFNNQSLYRNTYQKRFTAVISEFYYILKRRGQNATK